MELSLLHCDSFVTAKQNQFVNLQVSQPVLLKNTFGEFNPPVVVFTNDEHVALGYASHRAFRVAPGNPCVFRFKGLEREVGGGLKERLAQRGGFFGSLRAGFDIERETINKNLVRVPCLRNAV